MSCSSTRGLLLLLALLSAAGPTAGASSSLDTIHIFTKPAPPMSYTLPDGTVGGYSIDFWKNHMAPELGITNVDVTMLQDNNDIMSSNGLLSGTCTNNNVLCVGAAAISITASREQNFDFLASYYTNNVRMLTIITPNPVDVLYQIILAVWQLVVGLIIFFWFFNFIMAPVIWGFEMLGATDSKLPIFMPSDKSIDKFGGQTMWSRGQYIVVASFKNAVVWTISTFLGSQLARPQSKIGRVILLPLTRISAAVLTVIATAACAAIFTIDASQAATIGGLADLGPGNKICYNTASSFNTGLVTTKASEFRFRAVPYSGLDAMFDGYYNNECDAVIYDDVILQGDLIGRRSGVNAVAEGDPTYDRVQKSGVVGDSLKWDPYGFLVKPGPIPDYELVNSAVIKVATDSTIRETLEADHMRLAERPKTGIDLTAFGSQWVWMPSAIGAGVIFTALVLVYIKLLCMSSSKKTRKSLGQVGHSKTVRSKMLAAKLERGMADIALQPSNELIHDMAFEMQDLQTMMHSALEILRTIPSAAGEPSSQAAAAAARPPQTVGTAAAVAAMGQRNTRFDPSTGAPVPKFDPATGRQNWSDETASVNLQAV